MTKLSKAQVAILRRMANDEDIGWFSKGVREATLDTLRELGFIRPIEAYWKGGRCIITPAGRAYLEAIDDQP